MKKNYYILENLTQYKAIVEKSKIQYKALEEKIILFFIFYKKQKH